ncbi:MAG: putative secreted protein [Edaphobacter sp.]|nr:putative secreted protein [Edaphobacter sp.]
MDRVELRTLDAERTTVKLASTFILWLLLCLVAAPSAAHAHVGSKDVFETVNTGPYKLYVTIRTPTVIPGVATVEVRSSGANISSIHITPLPITGEASKHPPTSDPMARSAADPAFFTGSLWMMASGSWEVRFQISGEAGEQTVSVPVPAVALGTLKMQRGLGAVLGILGLFLVVSMAGIVAAAVRDARLKPGAVPSPDRRRRAVMATAGSLVFMSLLVWGGATWWNAEAASYSLDVYQPLRVDPVLSDNVLDLNVRAFHPDSERRGRSNSDFLPDHGHLMHLYAIREPEMDAVFHLHPELAGPGDFRILLPAMPAGDYTLYGDVVHASGFPETLVSKVVVPENMAGGRPGPDDAVAYPQPLSKGRLGDSYKLPDGYVMVWDRPSTLTANTGYSFRFRLLDGSGKPAADMQPYMGMAGHAAFVKTDGTVFAHTHPEGSAAMAALMLANGGEGGGHATGHEGMSMDMPMDMSEHAEPVSSTVEFPYGFPSAGPYRIFVQMKHGTTIETGAFDALVQ